MAVFYILIVIIGAILNAILFWKIWNMCDNVAKITKKLCENSENTNVAKTICESTTATETTEQITEQISEQASGQSSEQASEQTSDTDETVAIIVGIIFACILVSFFIITIIM